MADGELVRLASEVARLSRDADALAARMRALEDLDNPAQRRLIEEFRGNHAQHSQGITDLQNAVHKMDLEGTRVTRERFRYVEREIATVAGDVEELREDAKSIRVTVRSVLITALSSIAVQIVLYFILKAGAK